MLGTPLLSTNLDKTQFFGGGIKHKNEEEIKNLQNFGNDVYTYADITI